MCIVLSPWRQVKNRGFDYLPLLAFLNAESRATAELHDALVVPPASRRSAKKRMAKDRKVPTLGETPKNVYNESVTQELEQPPLGPRSITPHVRARAWFEPRVRFWWLSAAVIGLIGIVLIFFGLYGRSHQAWLISNGVTINATIYEANGETLKHRSEAPESVVVLKFPWEGKEFTAQPRVLDGRQAFLVTGTLLPIHVNPANPDDWTALDAPLSPFHQAMSGMIILPIAVMSLFIALAAYFRTLRTWTRGEAVHTLIVETRIAAVAPASRVVKVLPDEGYDARIYTVYLPPSLSEQGVGSGVYIVKASPHSRYAVAATWFE